MKSSLKGINRKRNLQWLSMIVIPVLSVFIFSYIPMFGIIIAFKRYRFNEGILGSKWVGLKNFENFVKSQDFFNITFNTISLNIIFIFVGIVAAVTVAILIYMIKSRTATKIYQTILLTPHFLSWVIVSYMAYALLNPQYGIMNNILTKIGLEPVQWYSEPKVWPVILTIASVWKHVGMDCIVYYAALMGIDSSLFEAADIDGAKRWQRTRYVIIPCLVPLIVMLSILKVGGIFRADFGLFYQLPRDIGTLYSTTDVIDTYIYRTMAKVGDMSLSSAVGVLQSIVGCIMVLCTNWVSKKIDSELGLF